MIKVLLSCMHLGAFSQYLEHNTDIHKNYDTGIVFMVSYNAHLYRKAIKKIP